MFDGFEEVPAEERIVKAIDRVHLLEKTVEEKNEVISALNDDLDTAKKAIAEIQGEYEPVIIKLRYDLSSAHNSIQRLERRIGKLFGQLKARDDSIKEKDKQLWDYKTKCHELQQEVYHLEKERSYGL